VSAPAAKAQALSVTRIELEDFLYLEAALLDEWRLEEWLALFVPGARYLVPPRVPTTMSIRRRRFSTWPTTTTG
jgi:3-phenylpropionate/cinnamic acid dioxygenase small subunit